MAGDAQEKARFCLCEAWKIRTERDWLLWQQQTEEEVRILYETYEIRAYNWIELGKKLQEK